MENIVLTLNLYFANSKNCSLQHHAAETQLNNISIGLMMFHLVFAFLFLEEKMGFRLFGRAKL